MRYKRVRVSGHFLVGILTSGTLPEIEVFGLPQGSKFVYSIPDTINGIWIVVEHESFPEVEDGAIIPDFDPIGYSRKG